MGLTGFSFTASTVTNQSMSTYNERNLHASFGLGPRQKIHSPSCLFFGPSTALHPPAHIHKYALANAPCIRTKIRRNLAGLFFSETLKPVALSKNYGFPPKELRRLGMNIAINQIEPRLLDVRVSEEEIIVFLADGRTVSVSLAWSWRPS